MNAALFKTMFKANAKSIFSYAFGTMLYLWLVIWIYPSMADTKGIQDIMKQMPEGMLKAFNISASFNSLGAFIANEFYGLLFIIILAIFSIVTGTKLIARLVDRGSMAYLLSTPNSRVKIAITQMTQLITGLVLILLFATGGGLLGVAIFINQPDLHVARYIQMNVIGLLLFFVISGYTFFFSCLFNDEKRALSCSTIVTLLFYILNMVGKISNDLAWMKHISIFSLYQPQDIIYGSAHVMAISTGLFVGGAFLYVIAILTFRSRDLPL